MKQVKIVGKIAKSNGDARDQSVRGERYDSLSFGLLLSRNELAARLDAAHGR